MTTIFSNLPNKQIPSSPSQCTQTNPTASHLLYWANLIEKIGIIITTIVAIIGGLWVLTIVSQESGYNLGSALLTLLIGAISVTIICISIYISYHIPALLIGALASITQSTTVSANAALYSLPQGSQQPGSPSASATPSAPTTAPRPFVRPQKSDSWICKACSQRNSADTQFCKGCGKYK